MSTTIIELHPVQSAPRAETQLDTEPSVPPTPASPPSPASSAGDPWSLEGAGRKLRALPKVDGGREAWSFLAAATAIETLIWGWPYTIGILHNYWVTRMFPHDESTLTLAATLQTGLMFISTAALGPLFTAFPYHTRHIQIVGLIVSTISLICSGFVTKASHLILTMGVLYPFAGALYLPCATMLYEWFNERRGLATGLMFAGTGVGGTVFPFVVDPLLKKFGYKATMTSVGIGYFVLNAVSLVFIKRRIPLPRRTPDSPPARPKIDWSIAKHWAFWGGILVIFFASLGNFNPTLWIPAFADHVGAKHPDGVGLISIMNAASVPGNTVTGWISDRVSARFTIFVSCTIACIATLVLWGFGTSSPMLVTFSIVWGLTALSFVGLWSKLITRICRDDPTLPVLIFSLFAVLRGVGNLTSAPISTQLLKQSHFAGAAGAFGSTNYGAVLVYTAVTTFVGGVIGLAFPT